MLKWLLSLIASSFTFALADVLCDVCIAEHEERPIETAADDEEGVEMAQCASPTADEEASDSKAILRARLQAGSDTPGYKPVGDRMSEPDEETCLTAAQDAAIAGIVTIVGLLVSVVYYVLLAPPARDALATGSRSGISLKWRPNTHLQFWFAMLGGAVAFLHYFFLLKAFEGAPSTVLLPLVQVASVSVLVGSAVVAFYRNEPWITPLHLLAYVLMFIGGILPACSGQLSLLFERKFWQQRFVFFAILAELSLGLHDLMLSGCSYNSERNADAEAGVSEESGESFEFFVWSRLSFCATFIGMYSVSPSLKMELRDLCRGRVPNKYIALSGVSEGLTIVGFYLASIAYGLFYQAGIVHAAEASLSQLLNLAIAFILLRGFGIGRNSAVGSMSTKMVSFVMVTIGLFLCTLEDGHHAVKRIEPQPVASPELLSSTAAALETAAAMPPLHSSAGRRLSSLGAHRMGR